MEAWRTQGDRWAVNVAAARQFHAREGHLRVPRKAVEDVDGEQVKLGAFLDNTRRRASKLSEGLACLGRGRHEYRAPRHERVRSGAGPHQPPLRVGAWPRMHDSPPSTRNRS
ncbi:helicase associated domain-containing protein [Streptomyces sp. NPDC058305]|uniref:helicase associated domain-containing protein n=1 Tax=Streptomyces sp. NPDC058305 TaxID=3346438 RepID=UPI0036ECC943